MKIKNLIKKILNNDCVQTILIAIIYVYTTIVYKTSKIILVGNIEDFERQLLDEKPFFIVTWHGRVAMIGNLFKACFENKLRLTKKFCVLSSQHRDGKLASKFVKKLGYSQIFGSTMNKKKDGVLKKNGAISSIMTILKEIKKGSCIFLAPDGPRGPIHKINSEIVNIAKKHDVSIFPVALSYSFKYELDSWDKFQIPFPFGKIYVDFLEKLSINKDSDFEECNIILEKRLNKIEENDKILKRIK